MYHKNQGTITDDTLKGVFNTWNGWVIFGELLQNISLNYHFDDYTELVI